MVNFQEMATKQKNYNRKKINEPTIKVIVWIVCYCINPQSVRKLLECMSCVIRAILVKYKFMGGEHGGEGG